MNLDETVFAAMDELDARHMPRPSALLSLGTGVGLLPGRLSAAESFQLGELPAVPRAWKDTVLHSGDFHGLPVWLIEDSPGGGDAGDPAWVRAWPCWLAASFGARVMIESCAGIALPRPEDPSHLPLGSFALVEDHVNLSGFSPLLGLGESRLGPLFPDQSRLHDRALRRMLFDEGVGMGLHMSEVVAACTAGPSLDTPAELAWFARSGARVAVQGLASPALAAAHAGLSLCAIAVLVDEAGEPCDLAKIAAVAQEVAPALEDLLWAFAPRVEEHLRRGTEATST